MAASAVFVLALPVFVRRLEQSLDILRPVRFDAAIAYQAHGRHHP